MSFIAILVVYILLNFMANILMIVPFANKDLLSLLVCQNMCRLQLKVRLFATKNFTF